MLRSFYDTKDISKPIVYGICAIGSESPVYIGMTTNAKRRMDHYRNNQRCTNKKLADWLDKNEAGFLVLYSGENYKIKEAELIAENAKGLFNMVRGGDQNWRTHRVKPWMSKTGVRCPSGVALKLLPSSSEKAEYKKWRDSLSDVNRCLHEVEIAYGLRWHKSCHIAFKDWAEFSLQPVLKFLEGEGISPLLGDA
tara:strand:+ start:75 stop:659 length:585 start_codon:yes stop_codon:yes gene_type:complete